MSAGEDRKKRKSMFATALLVVSYLISVVAVGFGYFTIGNAVDIVPGMPSPVDFRAPRQIIDFYVLERDQEEAVANVVPPLIRDLEITADILTELENFFDAVGELRAQYLPIFSPFSNEEALVEDRPLPDYALLGLELNYDQARLLIAGDSATFAHFYVTVTKLFEDILERGISDEFGAAPGVAQELRADGFDEMYVNLGEVIVGEFLRPNMIIDEEATEVRRQEARDAVQPTFFHVNQMIVRAHDIIQPAEYRAIMELGLVGGGVDFVGLAGGVLTTTLVFAVAVLYILFFVRDMLENRRRILMLFTLYTVTIILARIMVPLDYFFTPVMFFAMLAAILIDVRLSIVLTVCLSIIAAAMEPMDAAVLNYAMVSGVFAAIIAKQTIVRGRLFVAMVSLGAVNVLMVLANYLMFSMGFSVNVINPAIFALFGGFITIWLCIGTLPFWESIFEVVTQNNLIELTNPNSALLRRMIIEIPGTYHHSLVVANLSETACHDIGADHVLARAGAYYHDIGKMQYPQYFAENQNGVNPHDDLPPRASVEVIYDHITRGLELARQYKLPLPIMAFVEEHHGTSLMKAFYHKERMENPGVEIDESDFRYKIRIPQSPESAVVMLADTCEAAVRSMVTTSGKNMDEMDGFVRKLIRDRLEDGQLEDSGLSIKDLDTIAKAFMRVFKGMYHERIPYPVEETKEHEELGDTDGE
ncbi:MAG: HDIG domain-containing protein [Defluviitaleaceae bacterium]|nr:HDIG domain-containing protein [Defluviitaleaceae bacterium]